MKTIYSYLKYTLYAIPLSILFLSCEKEQAPEVPAPAETQVPLAYDSLYVSGKVHLNQSCTICTIASGKDLVYSWELDLGILLGSGSSVTFNACCVGTHNVKCTISDCYGNSQSKEVAIVVTG